VALDTVKYRSPYIHEDMASYLEQQCTLKQGIFLPTGDVLYEFTSGQLEGSWDSRISFRVLREEWVSDGRGIRQQPCRPYLEVEASLHKFFLGQNIYGQVADFQFSSFMFLKRVFGELGLDVSEHLDHWWLQKYKHHALIPSFWDWQVCRIDWAEVYRLTPAAITEFFRSINHSRFPRRSAKAAKYGTNAVYFPGSFTTLKLYHKGPEFKEHDRLRIKNSLMQYMDRRLREGSSATPKEWFDWRDKKLKALQRLADNRLRVEVEIHADKLMYDFKERLPTLREITDDYVKTIHDREVFKLLREGKTDMETVRTYDKVKARLNAVYKQRTANSLFAFYMQLAARGEEVVRDEYSKAQFYANRKKLVEAGVSWLCSDIHVIANDTALPHDFAPVRPNPRRCIQPISERSLFLIRLRQDEFEEYREAA
jgi:II/X family phage/plasmid replication protein